MVLEVVTLIVAAIGALGGAAGFLALYMQHQDREARQRIAHWPPELRPVLLNIATVAAQVEQRPRDRFWVDEHVAPLIDRYKPLADVVASANKTDGGIFALLHAHLVTIQTFSVHEGMRAGEVAHHTRKQEQSGVEAVQIAHTLLNRL